MALTTYLAGTKLETGQAQKEATINGLFDLHDLAIAGRLAISTTGGTTTLTGTPAAPQAQNLFLDASGTLTSNATIEIPIAAGTGRNRLYVVKNGTTGAFTLTVKKVGGTGVTVTQGYTAILLYNDSDIVKLYERNDATGLISLSILPATIWARAYHNAAQSIANTTSTVLALNSERYDTDTIHDNSTNNSRLTCKTAGVYAISGHAEFAANATGIRSFGIRLNGATDLASVVLPNSGATLATRLTVSTVYPLAVNDYVELAAYQDSGGALNVNSGANYTPEFMMVRLGS